MKIKQAGFAVIREGNHTNSKKFRLINSSLRKPDLQDKIIIKEIIEIFKKFKKIIDYRGEWGF